MKGIRSEVSGKSAVLCLRLLASVNGKSLSGNRARRRQVV